MDHQYSLNNEDESHFTATLQPGADDSRYQDVSPEGHSANTPTEKETERSTRRTTGYSIRALFRRPATSPGTEQPVVDPHGPLGLHTLFQPEMGQSCLVDIVFVHGLGGGSRKSWSLSPSEDGSFWPQSWLSQDADFQQTRIHSYGYDSNWGKRTKSILNIHDFAQSLLAAVKNYPPIRRSETSIILVGHSMGGCIVKKAYVLARQSHIHQDFASRFHSMFFLGTPHRGSNLAATLGNILQVTWGSKPYVDDLAPDSAILTAMNDEFRAYAYDLNLWSFFETTPMPRLNRLVVDKVSATLGFGNEEVSFMDADHRNVCKFRNQQDPNYRKLRNSLSSAIDMIKVALIQPQQSDDQYRAVNRRGLQSYLMPVDMDSLEDDLATLEEFKTTGSCSWLTETAQFCSWEDRKSKSPSIFWLTGAPGAGKSVLFSHILEHLTTQNIQCSYYIFKHGKAGTRTIASMLLTLAFQMAAKDAQVKRRILQLETDGVSWESHDERAIWRKLFLSGIFQLSSVTEHCWVIDGLDECVKFMNIFKLASQLPDGLRIFVTSRSLPEIERGIISLGPRAYVHEMTARDTSEDLRLYVNTMLDEVAYQNAAKLMGRILSKANGSFLWTRLVVQDLEMAFTEEEVDNILNDIPDDLFSVYDRIVRNIQSDRRRTRFAKSILTWVSLATRPLTVKELQHGIKLDLHDTTQPIERTIIATCGQLVIIDSNSRVQLVHETARAFLLSEDLNSELAISGQSGHGQLSRLCLNYLCDHFRYPRATIMAMPQIKKSDQVLQSDLLSYAASHFSEHALKAISGDMEILSELRTFFSSTVLPWLEYHARQGDLSPVTRTAVNLRGYLGKVSKHVPPTEETFQLVEAWSTDLIRICAKFHNHLLSCPSSIHLIVPGLSPINSAISRHFTNAVSTIALKGKRQLEWNDCLMRIDYDESLTTAVGHGEKYFAVGRSNGIICVYDISSLQSSRTMQHPGRVTCIEFGPEDIYLGSSGKDQIIIWDPKTGAELHRVHNVQALAMQLTSDFEARLATKSSQIITLGVKSKKMDTISLTGANPSPSFLPSQPPMKAALSVSELGMLALCYRSHPVMLLDAQNGALLGQCQVGWNNGVNSLVFNPRADLAALVVAYTDGNLVVYNLHNFASTFLLEHVYAHSLACSSDGRSLLSGSNNGVIEIYEFAGLEGNHLELIHRITTGEPDIRGMAFSSDGLRFVNICPSRCRVWEPAALVRRDSEWMSASDLSTLAPLPARTSTVGMMQKAGSPLVTALESNSEENIIVCGKDNGDVVMISCEDGSELEVLYNHSRTVSVVSIAIDPHSGTVASADDSGRIIVTKVAQKRPRWSRAASHLDIRIGRAIHKIVLSPTAQWLVVSGGSTDEIRDVSDGKILSKFEWPDKGSRAIQSNPLASDQFMIIRDGLVHLCRWDDTVQHSKLQSLQLGFPGTEISSTWTETYRWNRKWLLQMAKVRGDLEGTTVRCWPISCLLSEDGLPEAEILLNHDNGFGPKFRHILGLSASRLIFLDSSHWVCSVDLDTFKTSPLAKRHFFILPEWLRPDGKPLCRIMDNDDIIFANGDGLSIVNSGLHFVESVVPQRGGHWRVTSGSMYSRTPSSTSAITMRPAAGGRLYSANLRSDEEVGI
ncbi:hypothetical protein KVR01_007879 [Diaporthe batatas]|uniref:uncharacterized protein n=1 Tax=Diaporthe batatas TaxID=748121 RepID=UPI001D03B8DC|nr:uncharacterized protein KVR01_007879 [Diaporthe batatas]KAG8162114.1 hypothetical protein KVR01_007879 [Diaporthe batatas]